MNERIGLSMLTELAIGCGFGLLIGAVMENLYLGVMFGAVGGLSMGWLIAVIVINHEKSKRRKSIEDHCNDYNPSGKRV